jgi:tRNA nucleotidyltransferase (CCA-adding enzyme)
LVCGLQQEEIIGALLEFGKIKEVGHAFCIILFTPNDTKENIEFTLPRTEISTGPGYRDFIITPDLYLNLEDDFSRRDATINAIGFQIYSINNIALLDHNKNTELDFTRFVYPFDCISDIRNKI